MCRCLARVCAGVLLFAAAGCTLDSFLAQHICVYGPQQIVISPADEVSATLQTGLSEAGIVSVVNRVGDDLRVGGVYQKRTAFLLHLREQKVKGRLQTVVRMQWDYGGDKELWQLIQRIFLSVNNTADEAGESPTANQFQSTPSAQTGKAP
jgi:hypothetical protein